MTVLYFSFRTILVWVTAAHLLVLIGTHFTFFQSQPPLVQRKSVVVKSISLNPNTVVATSTPHATSSTAAVKSTNSQKTVPAIQKPVSPPTTPKATSSPPSKKTVSPPSPKPKPVVSAPTPKATATVPSPKSSEPSPASLKKQTLLAQAQANLAKIQTTDTSVTTKAEQTGQANIVALGEVTSVQGSIQSSYEQLLVHHLQNTLRLPEKGAVAIELTINKKGHLVSCKIQEGSVKNRSYVEKKLLNQQFPVFGSFLEGKEQEKFVLILTSQL